MNKERKQLHVGNFSPQELESIKRLTKCLHTLIDGEATLIIMCSFVEVLNNFHEQCIDEPLDDFWEKMKIISQEFSRLKEKYRDKNDK